MVDPSTWTRHVIVCGTDGVGVRTIEQLHQAGVDVVAIDSTPDRRRAQAIAGWDVPLLTGSSREPQTLHDAGLWGAQAVLCVAADDLVALETALLVRELRPDVRVAVRLSNTSVGQAVAGLGIRVLDVTQLAAPSIAEACLLRRDHAIDIGGVTFYAVRHQATEAGTLRSLYGALAPLSVRRPSGAPSICPGRDEPVAIGDEVTVIGTDDELVVAGLHQPPGGVPPARMATGRGYVKEKVAREVGTPWGPAPLHWVQRTIRRAVTSVGSVADRGVRIAFSALVSLIVVSSLVLRFTYNAGGGHHLSLATAVYFTAETVSTVGYGDYTFSQQSSALEIFGIVLIVLGAALVTTNFALLTNALVSRRVEMALGRSTAHAMRGHVVLVGLGAVGLRVLEALLAAGRAVVVIEPDEHNRHLAQARALHVPVVRGDATLPDTLEAVQVTRASAVAVMTSNDLINIETGLAVREALGRRWTDVPVVLRVFDRQLARTVEQSFGFVNVRSTSAIAAPFFVGAALGLDVLGTFLTADTTMLVGLLTVAEGGGLEGLSMADLSARTRVIALGRSGGELEHPPRRETRFSAGDRAYLIGPYDEVLGVLRRDQGSGSPRSVDLSGGEREEATPATG